MVTDGIAIESNNKTRNIKLNTTIKDSNVVLCFTLSKQKKTYLYMRSLHYVYTYIYIRVYDTEQ